MAKTPGKTYTTHEGIEEVLLPTPPVGASVQWFARNDDNAVHAAIVTAVESPGRVKLDVFPPGREMIRHQGVWHRSSPTHDRPNNPVTERSGAWDYLPFQNIPQHHYEMHRIEREKADEARMFAQERKLQMERDYQENMKKIQEQEPQEV